jgi:antitoxin (DNA-binding transcriptional repressor) of toxin-antitoxin stability system
MIEVSVAETRKRLTELLRRVELGEKVIITRRGKPVGQLNATPTNRVHGLDIEAMRNDLAGLPRGSETLTSLLKMRAQAR